MKHTIQNDVYAELVSAVGTGDTNITVAKAVSPYRDIPAPVAGEEIHLTLVDSMAETTAIEIVNVTQRTDAGSGWELTVQRAREGTTAQSFASGSPVFLAITKAAYDAKADTDDLGTAAFENSTAFATSAQGSNADTAHGWGDHGLAGYVETETDPTVPAHVKAITGTQVGNWDVAFGWGDHSGAGYAVNGTGLAQVRNNEQLDVRYLQSESDPTVPAHVKSITSTNITNWNTAHGWGDHSSAGYLVGPFGDTMHGNRGGGNLHANVTTTVDGFMSSSDKVKLNGVEAGAQANVSTNLSQGGSGNSRTINSSTGSNVTISTATTINAGFMSTGDKSKLDSIAAGAQVNTVDSVNGHTGSVVLTSSDIGAAEKSPPLTAFTGSIDLSAAQNFAITLAAASTAFTFANLASNVGQSGIIVITQDATGGRTFTLPAEAKTPLGGAAIVQTTTANSKAILNYVVVSSTEVFVNYIGGFV